MVYEQYYDFWNYINDKIERLGKTAPQAIIDGGCLLENGFQQNQQMKEILNEAYDLQLQGLDKEKILRSLKKKYEQG